MKKLLSSKVFWLVSIDVIILTIMAVSILFTLTYKSVPVQYQHYWFGDDLHAYLVFEHAVSLGCGIILCGILDATLLIKLKD